MQIEVPNDFNRVYSTFKKNAEAKGLGFQCRTERMAGRTEHEGFYFLHVSLNFEAHATASPGTLDSARVRAEKDHLASILALCGLVLEKDEGVI